MTEYSCFICGEVHEGECEIFNGQMEDKEQLDLFESEAINDLNR